VADDMADSSGLAITFQADIPQPHDWPAPVQVCLYRILQEALTNIVRHARAQSIDIALKEQQGHVLLTVSDDGKYSEEQPIIPGFGLRNMASRCRELGGTCTWQAAAPAGGLSLSINLPLLQNTHIREGTR
jgi:signal transduction histidine kinase